MGYRVILSIVREELATLVGGALPVSVGIVDHLPDSVAPPCVLIGWADPWIAPSTFCAYQASMEVIIVAQRIEPGGKLETLEEIVSAILPAVKKAQAFQVTDVSAPFPMQIAGVDYLSASINITHDLEG